MNMQKVNPGSKIKNITDLQVGAVVESIVDRGMHLYSDERIKWDGSVLSYTQPIDLNFTLEAGGDYAINRLPTADSPISIANNSVLVVRLNRTSGTTVLAAGTYPGLAVGEYAVVATSSLNAVDLTRKDHVVLFRRKDLANGDNFLFSPISKQVYAPGANEFLNTSKVGESFATTATATATTTLLNTSAQVQQFTGTLTQNCKLPDATTMSNGMWFYVANRSSQSVTVQYDDASTAIVLSANTQSLLVLISNGTTNGTWDIESTSAIPVDPEELLNVGLATSVATNALTVALKQSGGSTDPSTSGPVKIAFRSSTITSGQVVERTTTAALSLTVASGATLGHASAVDTFIYVYALDNSGTVELAVSSSNIWDERILQSTTALSGSSNSATTLYSTTARSNVAIRLIGRLLSNQTTAGTWAANMSAVYVGNFPSSPAPTYQILTVGSGTYTKPIGCKRIKVKQVGAGGGGAGSRTNGAGGGTGTNGGDTTFGSSLLTAFGGTGGTFNDPPGNGGSYTINSPAKGFGITGVGGGNAIGNTPSSVSFLGGNGGSSPFFSGGGGVSRGAGLSAVANTGSGGAGAGAGAGTDVRTGAGGGSGGYLEAIIDNPLATYSYTVGAKGTGGAAGTGGSAGGDGADGIIIVEEFYY